jgi:hypothetical protein
MEDATMMLLRITDGTTTINLTGGPITLQEYTPKEPDFSTVEFVAETMADGGELLALTSRNVTEQAQVTIVGATQDDLRAQVQGLERLFAEATERQRQRSGTRVYVEFRPDESGDVYRSEILYGKVALSTRAGLNWRYLGIEAAGIWRRRYYWEGPETELPLSNGGGSGLYGRTIYNHSDGGSGHNNWVHIAAADVLGVAPAPLRLQVTNNYNVSARLYDLIVAQNVNASPATLAPVLEGESAAYPTTGNATDATCSGGSYKSITWAGNSETLVARWTLDANMLAACQGQYFRVLARTLVPPAAGTLVTMRITFPAGTPLTLVAAAPETELSSSGYLHDLGVLQIPPWLAGANFLAPVDLTVYGRRTGGGTLALDYLHLIPLDAYRVLTPRGYGTPYGYRLVDDGMDDQVWTDNGAGSAAGYYLGLGQRVAVWPGRDQRLYFLMRNDGGRAEIERTASVRAFYRPRRVTV